MSMNDALKEKIVAQKGSMAYINGMYEALVSITNEKIAAEPDKSKHGDIMQNLASALINDVIRPLEYWTHYKGGIYMVLTVSIKEDTLEPVITYHSLKYNTSWVRTVANFLEMVTLPDGTQVNRFKVGVP